MSCKPSSIGRGCGDTLTRRLLAARAVIVARGKPSWTVSCVTPRFLSITVRKSKDVPRAMFQLSRLGASVCTVTEHRTFSGCRVSLGTGVEWLLLSPPVCLQSKNKNV